MILDPGAAALVVAHPDDEVLWASSILARVPLVCICFGDVADKPALSEGRRRALARFPLASVEGLDVPESGAFGLAAWPEPEETPLGLALQGRRDARVAAAARAYAANHARLTELLRPRLRGFAAVVTHNPWGEYGHEEHVQVFRVVEALGRELGFAVWVSGYVSEKSAGLARRRAGGLGASTDALPTDPALGRELQALYTAEDCWTWFDDYAWPEGESFHLWAPSAAGPRRGAAHALNWITLGWSPPARPTPLRRIANRLRRLGLRGLT